MGWRHSNDALDDLLIIFCHILQFSLWSTIYLGVYLLDCKIDGLLEY
jgi:hypothetical protein